jgi:hypothetical protein
MVTLSLISELCWVQHSKKHFYIYQFTTTIQGSFLMFPCIFLSHANLRHREIRKLAQGLTGSEHRAERAHERGLPGIPCHLLHLSSLNALLKKNHGLET